MTLLHSFWLILPAVAGGAAHIAVIKLDLLPELARVPLDLGLRFRGRRVFGDNKTLRGLVVMPAATALFSLLQGAPGVADVDPLAWGLALGFGYIAGELPNSFIKRQLGVAPGEAASGALGGVFWVVDQLDGLAGALLAMRLLWIPPADVVASLVVLTLLIHPLMAALMYMLGLKRRIG
ncbi:MAG TPA: CDP-archaeol synthase [Burkholderiales bacterium]|nr:CDP-archaeol synthase [Burkholderiales bacterium]